MKKIIIVLIILSVLCPVSFATTADNPFETMTDEEIMACYQLTMEQMNKRGLSPYSSSQGVTIPAGVYVIGKDIPQGSYRIEFPDDDLDYGFIHLFDANGEKLRMFSVGKLNNVSEIGKLDLVDGMTFELDDTSSVFYTYKGLFGDFND